MLTWSLSHWRGDWTRLLSLLSACSIDYSWCGKTRRDLNLGVEGAGASLLPEDICRQGSLATSVHSVGDLHKVPCLVWAVASLSMGTGWQRLSLRGAAAPSFPTALD